MSGVDPRHDWLYVPALPGAISQASIPPASGRTHSMGERASSMSG